MGKIKDLLALNVKAAYPWSKRACQENVEVLVHSPPTPPPNTTLSHFEDEAPPAFEAKALWPIQLKPDGAIHAAITWELAERARIVEHQAQSNRGLRAWWGWCSHERMHCHMHEC